MSPPTTARRGHSRDDMALCRARYVRAHCPRGSDCSFGTAEAKSRRDPGQGSPPTRPAGLPAARSRRRHPPGPNRRSHRESAARPRRHAATHRAPATRRCHPIESTTHRSLSPTNAFVTGTDQPHHQPSPPAHHGTTVRGINRSLPSAERRHRSPPSGGLSVPTLSARASVPTLSAKASLPMLSARASMSTSSVTSSAPGRSASASRTVRTARPDE